VADAYKHLQKRTRDCPTQITFLSESSRYTIPRSKHTEENPPLQPNDHKRLMTEKKKERKIGGVSDPNLIIKEKAQVTYIY
jgi:hypothetical protein